MLYFRQKFIEQIFIFSKDLWKDNDSIMTDCGLTIDKELGPLNMRLSIPLFLYGQIQLLKDEATESENTDCAKIYTCRKSCKTNLKNSMY